jgi:hypothetical protein
MFTRAGRGKLAHISRGRAPVPDASYEIRIRGRLSPSLNSAFDPLTAHVEPTETLLCGRIEDQAALHGYLERIESLGLELVEVRRITETPRVSE